MKALNKTDELIMILEQHYGYSYTVREDGSLKVFPIEDVEDSVIVYTREELLNWMGY